MRMLLLLLVFLTLLWGKKQHSPYLIVHLFETQIFTSEGTYYKLHIHTKHVEWHHSLGFNLLSFELGPDKSNSPPSAYFLPTLDGHFLFVDTQSQILIDRKQMQQLLHVCFQVQKDGEGIPPQYFIYEKYEYYIINLENGSAMDMESYLKTHLHADKGPAAVLKVSKKYLKQLRSDLTIAWSTISSEIDLLPISVFLNDPKTTNSKNHFKHEQSGLQFRRVGNNDIEMITADGSFQIGGSSHILAIFSHLSIQFQFINHPLPLYTRSTLALEHKPQHSQFKELTQFGRIKNNPFNFPHSQDIKKLKKDKIQSRLEFCINSFRSMQAITDESKNSKSEFHFHFHKPHEHSNATILPSIQHVTSLPQVITYGPTDDQPYVWIALILALLSGFYWLYRVRITFLLNELSTIESQTDLKLSQFQKRLGQVEQLKKMYEVHWDKLVYRLSGEQWYEHLVFQGRFLNQSTFVYAVRLQGTDVVSLEHKLNLMLNFSNKGITKLYYYTRNSEFLLIFTQKIGPLSLKKLQKHLQVQISNNAKKNVINELLESVAYLDSKIEINYLPLEAVSIEPITQNETEGFYNFKLSVVPCLLRKSADDIDNEDKDKQLDKSITGSSESDTYELRLNLIGIFHLIFHQGQPFEKKKLDDLLRNQAYSQQEYLEFFDFILYQVKSKAIPAEKEVQNGAVSENSRQLMFRYILDHPFLWDSKRKILFLSDFSNYIQTHIDDAKVRKLQSHARDYKVIKVPWIKQFHPLFVKEVSNYRKYDYESVRDLIRVIRNKLNHFHEIPKQIRMVIGKTPDDFIQYCLNLFPKLLHFAFVYSHKKKWKLHMK